MNLAHPLRLTRRTLEGGDQNAYSFSLCLDPSKRIQGKPSAGQVRGTPYYPNLARARTPAAWYHPGQTDPCWEGFMNLRLFTVFIASACLAFSASLPATEFLALSHFQGKKDQGAGAHPHFPKVQGAGALPEKVLNKSLGEGSSKDSPSKESAALRGEQILFELNKDQEARLFASPKAPAIGVILRKGSLVWSLPGSEEGDYRQVLVPGGFPGWVFARFVQVDSNGRGRTIGRRVSFRYRPETKSYPLTLLPRGAKILALSKKGDWWKVIVPDASLAWVEKVALKERLRTPLDPTKIQLSEALVKRLEAQKKEAQAPFFAKQAEWKAAQKKREAKEQLEKDLLAVQKVFEETGPKAGLPELRETEAALKVLQKRAKALALKNDSVTQRLRLLQEEVDRRRLLLDAKAALAEASLPKIKKVDPAASLPKIHPRRRFLETGWLERRPGFNDYSPYRLVKGGRTLYYLSVPGGRYDLEDFVGREVGVLGQKVRPKDADFRVIQVKHLVILSGR